MLATHTQGKATGRVVLNRVRDFDAVRNASLQETALPV